MAARRPVLVFSVASLTIGGLLGLPAAGAGGPLTEYPLPTADSRPYDITPGLDGGLWFTESDSSQIGRISTSSVIRERPLPTPGSGPYGITLGPDGSIWFTERLANRIARLTRTGTLSEFPVPTAFAQPWGITTGPDGNLWFTEENANQIGRITPSGAITEFGSPACCLPTFITAGRDGNLWYTVEDANQVVRMTTSGGQTVFDVPSEGLLYDIAPGPDGNLWFTELIGPTVGRITPSGQVTEFSIPVGFGGVAGVVAGHDGNMYFTENDAGRVGAIATDGTFLRSTTTSAYPFGLTTGSDGNVWIAIGYGNAIGELAVGRPGLSYVLSYDAGFIPRVRTIPLGSTVQWTFYGPKVHSVREQNGVFDSGPVRIVGFYSFTFEAAGTYHYGDQGNHRLRGTIEVAPRVATTGRVGRPFSVRWAMGAGAAGRLFDVEVLRPSGRWETWRSGTGATSGTFTPDAPGTYRFRARTRVAGGAAVDWSPAAAAVAV